NPYILDNLSQINDSPVELGFVYPPITLSLFKLFTIFDVRTATYLFLLLKLVALAGLFYLWRRWFLDRPIDLLFLIFCIFAFREAILLDLRAGNISIFEQLALWTGFVMWRKNRLLLFTVLIVIVSLFKGTPILFLGLLLFTDQPKARVHLIGGVIIFAMLHIASYVFQPDWFISFFDAASKIDERGIVNPSSLSLIQDIIDKFTSFTGIDVPNIISMIVYAISALIVVYIAWRLIKSMPQTDRRIIGLFIFCLTYALIVPRFKDYSYILLIVPTYYIIKKQRIFSSSQILLICIILFTQSFIIIRDYASFLAVFSVWLMGILTVRSDQPEMK
ncbi:MAG: glycosyltransferase family 87 protein, partial [Candidatus Electryoneaceae bacterium]|nr:glycosyltransferase family 87 protein [Candidatus Electryoneaceae bacterium]